MLSQRVAQYLLERGRITPSQLDEARRTQGFFGGQLESHILKLGFVDEAALGEALTEVTGVPYAAGAHLRAVPPDALAAVPPHVAERHLVCPVRVEEGRLRLAMLNPRDRNAISEVQAASRLIVEPWVTSEYRLHQALERHYRIRLGGSRPISLAPPGSGAASAADAPRGAAGGGPAEAAAAEVGLDGRPLDALASFEDYVFTPRDDETFDAPPEAAAKAEPAIESPPRSPVPPEITTVSGLEAALIGAEDRDDLAAALLAFCARRGGRAGLFAVARDGIRGVAGIGRAFGTEEIRKVQVAPGSGTVFDTALKSRDFYFGVVPALPANRDLYVALGGRLPATVFLLPILVRERTAALLYLDGDDRPIADPDIPLMRRVAAKAGLAFEMLLLKSKLRAI